MPSPTRRPTCRAWPCTTRPPPGTATRLRMPSSRMRSRAGCEPLVARIVAPGFRWRSIRATVGTSASGRSHMHQLSIPQSVIDRVIAKRGRARAFENMEPSRTALVVVDMQNAFMLPGVAHALCPMAEKIVPNINRLAAAVRASGGCVVWIKTTFKEDALRNWSTYFEMVSPEQASKRIAALTADSKGHALWGALEVKGSDVIVEKNRFSAFIQGSSNLAEVLRARSLDTVLITGTVTNVCCESTARDAMMLNFKTIMVSDANAAVTDEDHNASLAAFYLSFGDVMSTAAVIACLEANAALQQAAE